MNLSEHEDMSPWAVHFTAPTVQTEPVPLERSAYDNIMSILWDGLVSPFAEPHGAAAEVPEVADGHRSAAFSEVPLHLLERISRARSRYGVGFDQRFLLNNGGGRVWYAEANSAPAVALQTEVTVRIEAGVELGDPLWTYTPFIDIVQTEQPFRDWRWEREWRVPGGLRFGPEDIAFLFLPEEHHNDARQFFEDHSHARSGPAYLCPYIDVSWDRPRIAQALANLPV